MQKIAFILALFFTISAWGQNDSAATEETSEADLIKYFSKLDVDDFTDKLVDSFILSLAYAPIKMEIVPSRNPFYLGLIKVSFPKGIYANIYISEFVRANPNGICKKRNLRLARKETIAAIHILNEIACLQGCR